MHQIMLVNNEGMHYKFFRYFYEVESCIRYWDDLHPDGDWKIIFSEFEEEE